MSTLTLGDSLILDTDYSTTEKKTGATWIDGKPIYRKIIKTTCPSTQVVNYTVPHGISNFKIAINAYAFCLKSSNYQRFLNFAYHGEVQWCADFGINSSNVLLEFGSSWIGMYAGEDMYIVLEYTKTTD